MRKYWFIFFCICLFFDLKSQNSQKLNYNPVDLFKKINAPVNPNEFNSTIKWIEGKANQNVNYIGDNNNYTDICLLSNDLTDVTYIYYTITNEKKDENVRIFSYKFNLKDISYFEIYDSEYNNHEYKVFLYTYNSEYKIHWGMDGSYKLDNHVEIIFNNFIDKKRIEKAFTDLLKYAGSKKEKY